MEISCPCWPLQIRYAARTAVKKLRQNRKTTAHEFTASAENTLRGEFMKEGFDHLPLEFSMLFSNDLRVQEYLNSRPVSQRYQAEKYQYENYEKNESPHSVREKEDEE